MQGLNNIRVIDFSTRIAGHYASKMLVDAGAEVIKIEPPQGDALRSWSASGVDLHGKDSAFFRYLNTGKKSVIGSPSDPHVLELIASADLVIETYADDVLNPEAKQLATLQQLKVCEKFPGLVMLSISSYGRTGPCAHKAATEFTLQAESGSLSTRGRRDQPPVMAGGKITEYVGGTFAAVAALAAVLRAQNTLSQDKSSHNTRTGEYIDFSLLEVFNIAGTSYADMMSSLWGRPEIPGVMRNVEVPSIEPTKDGWVGFATNSFQQYSDFLVMIGRPDLLEQKDLANAPGRSKRMKEWNEIVHAWTREHTTAEIIEIAALLRIPVAPVNNGKTVLEHEQLVARKVFVENPPRTPDEKTFLQPRPPYLIGGNTLFPFKPAPQLGEHQSLNPALKLAGHQPLALSREASTSGSQRAEMQPVTAQRLATNPELPLKGIRVLDATAWWAGPSATQMLAHLGAEVIHLEAIQRPDGSRMMGGMYAHQKDWHEYSAMFLSVNTNKLGMTLNLDEPKGTEIAKQLIAQCDVFVENYSPRVIEKFGLDWQTVHAINPKCIMVRMPAFGLDGPWKNHVGFAQTMEQISGMAWLTGHVDDQPRIQRGPCDPMAGMNSAFATLVALNERETSGKGCLIECPMVEGALNAAAEQIVEYSAYGNILKRMGNRSPDAAPQGLYACANHDRKNEQWLALSIETDAQWRALKQQLGKPDWANDPALNTLAGRRQQHDKIDRELQSYLADKPFEQILMQWEKAGIPVAPVTSSVKTWNHPQLMARHFFEPITHSVVGQHLHVGAPFSFATRRRQSWLHLPAPTIGQHNREILSKLLGLTDSQIVELEQQEIIGTQIKGL
jgi:crotonobetainyl-CoA:carnitine CoA-transferase CaiB-like acyl-CoA transferase